ncbi:MAG: hypothetical protein ACRC41_16120 [Sarcina sp.]
MIYQDNFNDFIRAECLWSGTKYKGRIYRENFMTFCDELGIEYKKTELKNNLYEMLMKHTTHYKLYMRFRDSAFGVPSHWYEEKFGINKSQRKKMLDTGFIKIRYSIEAKVFTGTYADVPYVDAHQFYHMTQDKIDAWREKNIRGFKRK